MTTPIPSPPGLPFVGNVSDINPDFPVQSLGDLADTYGPIYNFSVLGTTTTVVSSVELMTEVCEEKRFSKGLTASLREVRNGTHGGLFTAFDGEHSWQVAHRVLVPAFGPLNIRAMFDDMKDIASQLVMKWARHGSEYRIPVTDDFTRLTLDTLALCSMDFRFNSFYNEQMHPFVDSMVRFLAESGARTRRPGLLSAFYRRQAQQYQDDIEYMRQISLQLVQERKDHPDADRKDLLNAMLYGKAPGSGEQLNDGDIVDNMITFLIAGHETTSGLLSFTFYYLLKNPAALLKAQEEADRVIGDGSIQVQHLSKLPFITAAMRESLRLQPTAPAFAVTPKAEFEVLGGEYRVPKGQGIVCLLPKVHTDPAVYGEDAHEWRAERMLDENFNKLPAAAWKPFGNGARGCIGRPFAWQETQLVIAMLLRYFDFSLDDASYNLKIKSTLTIKPKDFYMRATLRDGLTATKLESMLSSSGGRRRSAGTAVDGQASAGQGSSASKRLPLTVLYGSNTGTCQAFATRMAADAPAHGFEARVDTLDSAKGNLPSDQPVVLIAASYEGEPCDNARHFQTWIESLKDGEIPKVTYAVFGAGHSDWKATFHKIPTAIDDILSEHGERICKRGGADASAGDMFSDFEAWEDQTFWPAMAAKYSDAKAADADGAAAPSLTVQVSNVRSSRLRADVSEARVVSTRTLTKPGAPEKRHVEIGLPSDMRYTAGDYLAILPLNPPETVQRVMRHYGLAWDSVLTIGEAAGTILPANVPLSATDLFGAYVELGLPATRRNVALLVDACKDEKAKAELVKLSQDSFRAEITDKRVSLLDLLDRFPSAQLPLANFIESLPPMRTRSYSISSSSLWNSSRVTLTYGVLRTAHASGQGEHVGVASNFLSRLGAGDSLHVAVRPSNQAFHLPTDSESTPVIMICAGTGLAPFRGFVQERAAQVAAGRKLARALLFVGCRSPETDELYRDELDAWESLGAVQVVRVYSRAPDRSSGNAKGCKYAQDALLAHRDDVLDLWDKGARVYVCGSRDLEAGVQSACRKLAEDRKKADGEEFSEERYKTWFDGIRNVRFATDVFT